jgi:tripartite ATP-independent transporter DctM subunit
MGAAETLAIALVFAAIALLLFGYPVALTLAGTSLIFALLGDAAGVMNIALLGALPQRIFGVMTNEVLLAIPLFVFMGVMLERSRIAEELLETMGRLFGSLPGGLAISAIIVGTLLAAAKGVVGATTVTMGLITLPAMMRHGYDPRLAAGTVAATATLAQIMPPATVLILLADQINIAYQSAQLARGIFAPASVSVGDLFAGAILPAGLLVLLYLVFQVVVAVLRPQACPPVPPDPAIKGTGVMLRRMLEALVAPILLIIVVLGSILWGLATPTEAAAVGAFGAILLTAYKTERASSALLAAGATALVLALRRLTEAYGGQAYELHNSFGFAAAVLLLALIAFGTVRAVVAVARSGVLREVLASTAHITAMIFTILIGATMFSLVFRGLGGDDLVQHALAHLPGGTGGAIVIVMIAMFLLGFVMDAFEIIFVVVPIVAPALLQLPGIDPIWLGIMMAMNLQMSYIHPPLGPTLFFLRGVAPPDITTMHIYIGAIPFVLIQMSALVLLWYAPQLATLVPSALYGR